MAMCEWLHVWNWPASQPVTPPWLITVDYDESFSVRACSPQKSPEQTESHQGQTTCYRSGSVQIPQHQKTHYRWPARRKRIAYQLWEAQAECFQINSARYITYSLVFASDDNLEASSAE